MESRIFCGQRSLGYVCNDIPLQIRYVKKHRDTFIITVVGKRFYTYSVSKSSFRESWIQIIWCRLQAAKLHLYSISEFHPSDIVALAVDPRFVYTACQEDVRIFKRGVEPDFIHSVPNVRHILPFGELVVAVAENTLIVFARESGGTCTVNGFKYCQLLLYLINSCRDVTSSATTSLLLIDVMRRIFRMRKLINQQSIIHCFVCYRALSGSPICWVVF